MKTEDNLSSKLIIILKWGRNYRKIRNYTNRHKYRFTTSFPAMCVQETERNLRKLWSENLLAKYYNNLDYYHGTYRVSQEECVRLRENVPYVKVHRYNPKHLYPKLNDYGDNGQRKVWSSCGSTYCTC